MRGRRESAKRRKYRRKKKKKPKSLAPVGLVLDPVAVVTDVLLPFLRLPRRENGFPLPVPQPQPPAPLVLVPVGALERPAAVPEPSQGLSDVAAAVGEAQLAVPRPWRRREAGLPRRDVFGGRDEGVLVELEFVLGAGGVGVKGVEPRKESFFCANGGENGRRRRRGRKRGENDSGGGVLQTFASLFPLSLSLSLSLSLPRSPFIIAAAAAAAVFILGVADRNLFGLPSRKSGIDLVERVHFVRFQREQRERERGVCEIKKRQRRRSKIEK